MRYALNKNHFFFTIIILIIIKNKKKSISLLKKILGKKKNTTESITAVVNQLRIRDCYRNVNFLKMAQKPKIRIAEHENNFLFIPTSNFIVIIITTIWITILFLIFHLFFFFSHTRCSKYTIKANLVLQKCISIALYLYRRYIHTHGGMQQFPDIGKAEAIYCISRFLFFIIIFFFFNVQRGTISIPVVQVNNHMEIISDLTLNLRTVEDVLETLMPAPNKIINNYR